MASLRTASLDDHARSGIHRICVAQLGARMYYGVPSALHTAHRLEQLFTDLYCFEPMRSILDSLCTTLPIVPLRSFRGRAASKIPDSLVKSFPWLGLRSAYSVKRCKTDNDRMEVWLKWNRRFCESTYRSLPDSQSGVYGFNSASVELFRSIRTGEHSERRLYLEQTIAPRLHEHALVQAERQRWPGWESMDLDNSVVQRFAEREAEEWQLADVVLAPSAFVRKSLLDLGVPVHKIVLMPYGVPEVLNVQARSLSARDKSRPVHVGFVGSVGLRKGIQYFTEAASLVSGSKFKFLCVGPWYLKEEILPAVGKHVHLVGRVTRSEMASVWDSIDVCVLPSLCEGSATVLLEAMSRGIPCIATENAGSVIENGVDGDIVPIRSAEAIAGSLERLCSSPDRYAAYSRSCLRTISRYTTSAYTERLLSLFGQFDH